MFRVTPAQLPRQQTGQVESGGQDREMAVHRGPKGRESLKGFLEQGSRFLNPVFVGDTLYCTLTVSDLKAGQHHGRDHPRHRVKTKTVWW